LFGTITFIIFSLVFTVIFLVVSSFSTFTWLTSYVVLPPSFFSILVISNVIFSTNLLYSDGAVISSIIICSVPASVIFIPLISKFPFSSVVFS